MSEDAQFIQIAAVSGTELGTIADPATGRLRQVPVTKITLCALDVDGDVWTYEGAEHGWKMLHMIRNRPKPNGEEDDAC